MAPGLLEVRMARGGEKKRNATPLFMQSKTDCEARQDDRICILFRTREGCEQIITTIGGPIHKGSGGEVLLYPIGSVQNTSS